MGAITELLRGHHIIRFGNEPDRLYDCRIVNQVQLDWMYNDGTRKCTIPFYCQPLKMQYPIEEDIILTQPDTIDNPGTVNAYPTFTITVSESATVDEDGFCDDILFIVRGNDSYGHAITISNMKPGECIVVDWFMGDAYNYADKTNWNNRIIGNPQHLTTGENEISWSGAELAQVKITPHWRYA